MMFTNTEDIETDLIGEFDFLKEALHALDGLRSDTRCRVGHVRGKTVDSNLHGCTFSLAALSRGEKL
jgi:hypothetical protein